MTKKVSGKRTKVIIGSSTSLEHSPAAEGVVSNVDLLTEILLRVPAKSLIRFKSVSKNWLLLISDSRFAFNHAHQNRSCSISGLYFKYIYSSLKDPIYSVSLHGHPSLPTLAFLNGVGGEQYPIRIKASCNGLLLCVKDRIICNHYTTKYIVCNPTTQKYKVLPEPSGPSYESFGAYLAFDPSKSPHYKVVLFNYTGKIDIYSSESASWKEIRVTEQRPSRVGGVFWNGAIHWLSDEEGVHFRFEVDAEELIKTSNPPRPKILSLDKIRYFGECGGHLILIQMRLRFAMGFRILEMDRDSCHWIVKGRVNLRPLISVFPQIDDRSRSRNRGDKFRVLCVARGRGGGVNENDFAMVFAAAGKIISYNLKCKTLKVLHDHYLPLGNFRPSIVNPYHYSLIHQFVESISPV